MKRTVRYGQYKGQAIYSFIVATPGRIGLRRPKGKSLWQEVHGEVYLTCPKCGEINRVTGHVRTRGGHPRIEIGGYLCNDHCVTCIHCKIHLMNVRLREWKGPVYAWCQSCSTRGRGLAKQFKGWRPGQCPDCQKRYGRRK